jgi:putative transposase
LPNEFGSRNSREAITSRLRLRGHDYREPGSYFITVCAEHRQCLFGSIHESEFTLSDAGHMVSACWERMSERFPTVSLDGYVIMPNHLHGIITLLSDDNGDIPEDAPSLSDTIHWFKLRTIRQYAAGVKREGWLPYEGRLWQGGFMDHVIRNDREMNRLQGYIENNVALWEDDTFHPQGLHARRSSED